MCTNTSPPGTWRSPALWWAEHPGNRSRLGDISFHQGWSREGSGRVSGLLSFSFHFGAVCEPSLSVNTRLGGSPCQWGTGGWAARGFWPQPACFAQWGWRAELSPGGGWGRHWPAGPCTVMGLGETSTVWSPLSLFLTGLRLESPLLSELYFLGLLQPGTKIGGYVGEGEGKRTFFRSTICFRC